MIMMTCATRILTFRWGLLFVDCSRRGLGRTLNQESIPNGFWPISDSLFVSHCKAVYEIGIFWHVSLWFYLSLGILLKRGP